MRLAGFLGLFILAACGLSFIASRYAPSVEHIGSCQTISISWFLKSALPKAVGGTGDLLGSASQLYRCAQVIQAEHPVFVLTAYISTYVLLQAFAIPGPVILSVLAGALYGSLKGQLLIACCATAGASLCFILSSLSLGELLPKLAPERFAQLKEKVQAQGSNLVWYMLFLRLTPVFPNWCVNLCSPHAGVPLRVFILTTLVGLIPGNFLHSSTGASLALLSDADAPPQDTRKAFITLFALQFLALLPNLVQRLRGRGGSDGDVGKAEKSA